MNTAAEEPIIASSALTDKALIWSEKGLSKPTSLFPGENIITSDGKLVPIKEIVDCGVRTTYRVILANGMRTDSTYGRKLLVDIDGRTVFKAVENIVPGDMVYTVSDPKHPAGANADSTDISVDLMTLSRETLKNVLMLLFASTERNGEPRCDIEVTDENDVILSFQAASAEAASELQQTLLARFGVRSERFREQLTVSNENLKLLGNKMDFLDVVYPKTSCQLSQEQLEDLISLFWYSTDRQMVPVAVTDVSGKGRNQSYGIMLEDPSLDIVVDGMVSDTFKAL